MSKATKRAQEEELHTVLNYKTQTSSKNSQLHTINRIFHGKHGNIKLKLQLTGQEEDINPLFKRMDILTFGEQIGIAIYPPNNPRLDEFLAEMPIEEDE